MKVFVLTIPENKKRQDTLSSVLKAKGVNFEFFYNAIPDPPIEREETIDCGKYYLKCPKQITKGEYSCTLGHRALWDKIVNENLQEAIILEDDAILKLDYISALSAIRSQQKDAELICAHGINRNIYHSNPWLDCKYNNTKCQYAKYGAGSLDWYYNPIPWNPTTVYYIKQSGAEKLLKFNEFPFLPIDIFLWMSHIHKVNTYITRQMFTTTNLKSTIKDWSTTQTYAIAKQGIFSNGSSLSFSKSTPKYKYKEWRNHAL